MRHIARLVGSCLIAPACWAPHEGDPSKAGPLTQAIIHGDDDRLDYFDLEDSRARDAEHFAVALVRAFHADALAEGRISSLPMWGELDRLCPGEPFADQPAAAFCSGALVDWDLVLTARHCIDLVGLENIRAVFGYYYTGSGEMVVGPEDIYAISDVVATSDPSRDQGADYAWLRLTHAVDPPRRPASVYARGPAVTRGDAILTVSATGGVPLKWDMGGSVYDARETEGDYFIADTDTSKGSSGGAALDAEMNVVGILSRGSRDFAATDLGCRTMARRDSSVEESNEQFTFTHQAVAALCEVAPENELCAPDCGEPCQVSQAPALTLAAPTSPGCSITPAASVDRGRTAKLALIVCLVLYAARRPSTRPPRHLGWMPRG